jgi:hypothetical protein
MVKNYYYLVAGLLAILFAITHALNGQNNVLPELTTSGLDTDSYTIFFYVWHMISFENLVLGLAFLVMAFHKNPAKVRFAARLLALLIVARWLVLFSSVILLNASAISEILTDSIAMACYVIIIFLGSRMRKMEAI